MARGIKRQQLVSLLIAVAGREDTKLALIEALEAIITYENDPRSRPAIARRAWKLILKRYGAGA